MGLTGGSVRDCIGSPSQGFTEPYCYMSHFPHSGHLRGHMGQHGLYGALGQLWGGTWEMGREWAIGDYVPRFNVGIRFIYMLLPERA